MTNFSHDVVFALDISESMEPFMKKGVQEALKYHNGLLIIFNDGIANTFNLEDITDDYEFSCNRGSDFSCVIERLNIDQIFPRKIVVFTNESSCLTIKPPYIDNTEFNNIEFIIASNNDCIYPTPPFGTVRYINIETEKQLNNDGVHVGHCCLEHGCKYGDKNCPVANGRLAAEFPCEQCDEDKEWIESKLANNPDTAEIEVRKLGKAIGFDRLIGIAVKEWNNSLKNKGDL
jgi:hypothetical protein